MQFSASVRDANRRSEKGCATRTEATVWYATSRLASMFSRPAKPSAALQSSAARAFSTGMTVLIWSAVSLSTSVNSLSGSPLMSARKPSLASSTPSRSNLDRLPSMIARHSICASGVLMSNTS